MKYRAANKYLGRQKSNGLWGTIMSYEDLLKNVENNKGFMDQYEIYELVPARVVPAQAARIVRA